MAEKTKHANVYAALAALQGDLKPFAKTATVEFKTRSGEEVKYSYTPLADILETVYPLLAKNGLSVRHEIVNDDKGLTIAAILTHESAQWIEVEEKDETVVRGTARDAHEHVSNTTRTKKVRVLEGEIRSGPIKISGGNEMKDLGSAITYARRYSIAMVLGIASEEDIDAKLDVANAESAQNFAMRKVLEGIKTENDLVQAANKLEKLKQDRDTVVKKKKPSALGLKPEQFEQVIKAAEDRVKELSKDSQE